LCLELELAGRNGALTGVPATMAAFDAEYAKVAQALGALLSPHGPVQG
jgi:hypothetical protein